MKVILEMNEHEAMTAIESGLLVPLLRHCITVEPEQTAEPMTDCPAAPVAPVQTTQQPAPTPIAQPVPTTVPTTSVTQPVQPQPAPAPTATAVPTSQHVYTRDEISRAAVLLLDKDESKRPALSALLQQFGANSLIELQPEHFGAFVLKLRGMGALI